MSPPQRDCWSLFPAFSPAFPTFCSISLASSFVACFWSSPFSIPFPSFSPAISPHCLI
nr:MAG TPA: hypothetical protein [Caudoviricetes sp.]